MIKIQPFNDLMGFADDNSRGSYFWGYNLIRTQNGLSDGLTNVLNTGIADNIIPQIIPYSPIMNYAQYGTDLYFITANGKIWKEGPAGRSIPVHAPAQALVGTSQGNGMIVDQKGRLLYANHQYLGMVDFADGTITVTGTVTMTAGSKNVVGSGTNFNSSWINKSITVTSASGGGYPDFVAVITAVADSTHLTIDTNYTGTTGSKPAYAVQWEFTDNWKDFGSSIYYASEDQPENIQTPMELYESDVFIGRKNNVCCLHTMDDSLNTDSLPAFNLPQDFIIKFIKAGNGGVLIGAVMQGRSILVLWDGLSDRSIAPWIWLDEIVQSATFINGNWIVVTSRSILTTTGYAYEKIYTMENPNGQIFKTYPQGIACYNNKLIIANRAQNSSMTKIRTGFNIFDLATKKWLFVPVGKKYHSAGYIITAVIPAYTTLYYPAIDVGAVYIKGDATIHAGAWIVAAAYATVINLQASGRSVFITNSLGENSSKKIAEAIRLIVAPLKEYVGIASAPVSGNITITAKIAPINKRIWQKVTPQGFSANKNEIAIGTRATEYITPSIGDEVLMLAPNALSNMVNAGEIRHITAIANPGTNNEIWTLDSNLPECVIPGDVIEVSPFKKIGSITLDGKDIKEDVFFDIKNKIKSRKFYLKFVIENAGVTPIEIVDCKFIYDDQGYF